VPMLWGGRESHRQMGSAGVGETRGGFGEEGVGCERMAHGSSRAGPTHYTEKAFRKD
jgi:hypothetical protein